MGHTNISITLCFLACNSYDNTRDKNPTRHKQIMGDCQSWQLTWPSGLDQADLLSPACLVSNTVIIIIIIIIPNT